MLVASNGDDERGAGCRQSSADETIYIYIQIIIYGNSMYHQICFTSALEMSI